MGLFIQDIKESGLEITVNETVITISGCIDQKDARGFLELFFNKVHKQAIIRSLKEIIVDITKLSFMNSSGISEFSNWVTVVDELEDKDKKYNIRFISNTSEYQWQKSILTLLKSINPANVIF